MSIKNDEMRQLCIAGEMTNGQLADHFGVTTEEVYAWRSRHGMTINKCALIREGKVSMGKRTKEEIMTEIKKVLKVKLDAEKKYHRAEERIVELRKELKEAEG